MLDTWRHRNRDGGSVLTYGSLGFLAGVITALGIGGCTAPDPGATDPRYTVECPSK
jgi:hypothetical protein